MLSEIRKTYGTIPCTCAMSHSQAHKIKEWDGGCWGRGNGETLISERNILVKQDGYVLEICTI